MSNTIPNWGAAIVLLDNEPVDVGETIADHAANAEWDLTSKRGGMLFLYVGREATGTVTGLPVRINVRRNADDGPSVNSSLSRVGGAVSANATTINVNSSGQILQVASVSGFAAGDFIVVGDMAVGTRVEFARVAKVVASTLVLDDLMKGPHTSAQADVVTNQADLWQMWVPGGVNVTIQADYGAGGGPDVVIRAVGQIYTGETTT
ncbi:hypothetical protein LCGC14_0356830 [marine sediment metagenome]|uniref:Uncharacterized protein n=1 Tax=marine sediment metagenome TaxID=412755 RepID=A0A0F9TEL0_9ZZZZ